MSKLEAAPVIITRAEPGAIETQKRLELLGIPTILSPMIELVRTDESLPDLSRFAGVLFTSANGVRFFSDLTDKRNLPAWCVGPATFEAAVQSGFEKRYNANGDGVALADYIIAGAAPDHGPLLHVANSAASGDVASRLREAGFEVVFAPIYEARPAKELSDKAARALSADAPVIVLIHSAKGAKAFESAIGRQNIALNLVVAVSEKAALPLRDLNLMKVEIADTPNEDALIDALVALRATL
ncbi:MAG: uroporphyrinogen-III synthase [Pseudomonadota bacterium]